MDSMQKIDGHHFVFVHGDCHGAWCWYKVKTLLESAGQKVTALDMAASGMNQRQLEEVCTITNYLQPLMSFLEALGKEEKIILVGHSRGGVDVSIAMERYADKISAAVFVTAAMPGPHLDLPTISKEFEGQLDSRMDSCYYYAQGSDESPTSFLFGPLFLASKLYQLCPPEDLTLAKLLTRPSPMHQDFIRPTKETTLSKEYYGSVPRVFVVCEEDKVMKEDMQKWLIDTNPPNEVKVIKGADHMVMISKPQELSAYLLEIGDKYS